METENPFQNIDDAQAPSDPFLEIIDQVSSESDTLNRDWGNQSNVSEKQLSSHHSARFSVIAALVCLGLILWASVTNLRQESQIIRYAKLRENANSIDYSSRVYPANLAASDIMSDLDETYLNHLQPLVSGDKMSEWKLFQEIRSLFVDLSDASVIAAHLNGAFPIHGEPEFRDIEEHVADCAKLFGVDPPLVFVKSDSSPNAYVTGLEKPHILVVTSGFVETFSHRPDEVRFIIGHEMGHIACNHVRAHSLARFLVNAIHGDGSSQLRSRIIAPALTLKLLEWSRASELSADRAGLICVGRLGNDNLHGQMVAEQALVRLLHGTVKDVDTDRYLKTVIEVKNQHRFVDLFTQLQALKQTHPFIPERCQAIRSWVATEDYESLFTTGTAGQTSVVEVTGILLRDLPAADRTPGAGACDVILNMYCNGRSLTVNGEANVTTTRITPPAPGAWSFQLPRNGRLILEILDDDSNMFGSRTERVGSVVIHPQRGDSGTPLKMIPEPGFATHDTTTIELNYFVKYE